MTYALILLAVVLVCAAFAISYAVADWWVNR